jgi:hypothetical protein
MKRFGQLAVGKHLGEAIAAAYHDEVVRADIAFMEWLTKPRTTIWEKLEVMGYCRLDQATQTVQEVSASAKR